MSFIKEQQEEAQKSWAYFAKGGVATTDPRNFMDSLISQVVQNTVEEIDRRVEKMILYDPSPEGQYNAIIYSHNEAVKGFQSLLKDIAGNTTDEGSPQEVRENIKAMSTKEYTLEDFTK